MRRILPVLLVAAAVATVPCAAGAKPHGYIGGGREPSMSEPGSRLDEVFGESSRAPLERRRAASAPIINTSAEGLPQGPRSPSAPAGPGRPGGPAGPALPAR